MKTIVTVSAILLGIVAPCFGAGDPVSSVATQDGADITTFRRDGKKILEITLHHSNRPQGKRILIQTVFFNNNAVLSLSELQGKRTFAVREKIGVSVTIGQDASTGALQNAILANDSGMVEMFEVKDGCLTPVSGKQLDFGRSLTKDFGALFAPENMKKTTPDKFGKGLRAFVEKYGPEQSRENGKPTADKSSSMPNPAGTLVELTVRVVNYKGDMMHSSAIGEGGAIYHPDSYDAAVCEILSPAPYAGQQLQIWGWNRRKLVDPELRQKGNVVRLQCDFSKRRDPPWKSELKGFGQWEVKLSKAPGDRQ